jgi:putative tryptophan/tyrosine transport system substrate-binding protein
MTFCIGRREVITLIGGAAAAPTLLWPLAARAQKGDRKPRIGVLMNLAESDPEARPRLDAFERRLQELGWTKDRNVLIDYRWTAGDYDRMRSYAAELVGLGSNAILAAGAPVTEILQKTTGIVPIVFVLVSDPIGSGFIPSLAHPGGNMTGVTYVEYTLGGKWLEMLKEIARPSRGSQLSTTRRIDWSPVSCPRSKRWPHRWECS